MLGAAPDEIRPRLRRSSIVDGAVGVSLAGGIRLEFGEPVRVAAKWEAAARVLADPRVDQVTYIDLTVPERPAVGGTGAVATTDSALSQTPPAPPTTPLQTSP